MPGLFNGAGSYSANGDQPRSETGRAGTGGSLTAMTRSADSSEHGENHRPHKRTEARSTCCGRELARIPSPKCLQNAGGFRRTQENWGRQPKRGKSLRNEDSEPEVARHQPLRKTRFDNSNPCLSASQVVLPKSATYQLVSHNVERCVRIRAAAWACSAFKQGRTPHPLAVVRASRNGAGVHAPPPRRPAVVPTR